MITENFDIALIKKKLIKRLLTLDDIRSIFLTIVTVGTETPWHVTFDIWSTYIKIIIRAQNKLWREDAYTLQQIMNCLCYRTKLRFGFLHSFMFFRQRYVFWYTDTVYTTFKNSPEKSSVSKTFPLKYLFLIKQN